jgi:XTP/dITP diphosphohydrolase
LVKQHQIVLASSNPGKLREINEMLADSNIEVIPQSEFNVSDVEETAHSFVENALLKARHASVQSGLPAIADDSGIAIDALQGRPGIYSARYAGEGASDEENLWKLIKEVETLPENDRAARFVCLMVYLRHTDDPMPVITQGEWQGIAITEPKGENGFGYDPMFYLPEYQCTSAELTSDTKNKLSHRGQALRALVEKLKLII